VPAVLDVLEASVRVVIVGTHSVQGRARIRELLQGWTLHNQLPFRGPSPCNAMLRGGEAGSWETQSLLLQECFVEQTEIGPILPWDGELIFHNPRWGHDRD
jgi:hypothetical protein